MPYAYGGSVQMRPNIPKQGREFDETKIQLGNLFVFSLRALQLPLTLHAM